MSDDLPKIVNASTLRKVARIKGWTTVVEKMRNEMDSIQKTAIEGSVSHTLYFNDDPTCSLMFDTVDQMNSSKFGGYKWVYTRMPFTNNCSVTLNWHL